MPSAPIKRVPRTSNRIAMTPTAQSRTNLGISNARFGSMSNLDGQKEELCNCQHPADIVSSNPFEISNQCCLGISSRCVRRKHEDPLGNARARKQISVIILSTYLITKGFLEKEVLGEKKNLVQILVLLVLPPAKNELSSQIADCLVEMNLPPSKS